MTYCLLYWPQCMAQSLQWPLNEWVRTRREGGRMLPASLPKRIPLWPCIIYLLTRGDSIIIGFQAHKRASLSAQADLSRKETNHILLSQPDTWFCWPLSVDSFFSVCFKPYSSLQTWDNNHIQNSSWGNRPHKHLIHLFAPLIHTTTLWDNWGSLCS